MKCILSIFLIAMCSSISIGQDIAFTFFDAQTGKAIQPNRLVLQSQDKRIELNKSDINLESTLTRKLSSGAYQVGITAPGYKAMTDDFLMSENKSLRRAFYLRNLNPPKNISVGYVRSLHREDGAILVGYIVDENGMALANAKIISNDNEKTVTDEDGYFKLFLELKDPSQGYDIKSLEITKNGFKKEIRNNIIVRPFGDFIYKISLDIGSGENLKLMSDMIIEHGKIIGRKKDRGLPIPIDDSSSSPSKSIASCGIPNSISVGYSDLFDPDTDCENNCPFSITVDFETYVSEVLDNEWLTQWSTLTKVEEAYQAAAVAIRSFASWRRVVNPRSNPNYHITNNTNDQAYVPGSTSWAMTYAAATEGTVVKSNTTGNFISTNYAAETNNWPTNSSFFPCGNGFVINSVGSNQCISDPVTFNHPFNGHGWNMGQWGSVRWATGINLDQNYSGNFGSNHNHGVKTWQEILTHYYPSHELCEGTVVSCPQILQLNNVIASGLYEAEKSIIATGTLNAGNDADFQSPSIDLLPGFEGVKGSVLDAKFGGCQ